MKNSRKIMLLLAITLPLHATGAFAGKSGISIAAINENAEHCYQQTVAANQGAEPGTLSVKSCNHVLDSDYLSKQLESATSLNRGIVQFKQGEYASAEKSALRALRVSPGLKNAELLLRQIKHVSAEADNPAANQVAETR